MRKICSKYILGLCFIAAYFCSCTIVSKSKYESMLAENDSLRMTQESMMEEFSSYFEDLNQLQLDIDSINDTEFYIQYGGVENRRSTIDLAREKLKKNQTRIQELEERLNNTTLQVDGLRRNLAMMTARYAQAEAKISELDRELSKAKRQIARQDKKIASQSRTIENQRQVIIDKKFEVFTAQEEADRAKNSVYYIIGTKDELKRKNILSDNLAASPTGSGHEFFIEADKRNFSNLSIPYKMYEIKSKHPKDSYEIKGSSMSYSLQIKDMDRFWSTHYLIIVVK